jgi:outer membrane protein OmpA-like peptidoglycan-associated protein
VKALISGGIAAARLKAAGVGPYSPVASNKDEQGRAQNRRVELVEQ